MSDKECVKDWTPLLQQNQEVAPYKFRLEVHPLGRHSYYLTNEDAKDA